MRKLLAGILMLLSTQAQAMSCQDIWTQALSDNSAAPATINLPAELNPVFPAELDPIDYYYAGTFSSGPGRVANSADTTARLFIDGSLTIESGSRFNSSNPAENFILVVTGNLVIRDDVRINGFILAGGAVSIGANTIINGAVTAKGAVSNSGQVNFRPEAISSLIGGVLCEQLLAIDDFESYAIGSVAGQNGGTGWGGSWTGIANRQQLIDVSSQPLRYDAPNEEFIAGGERALQLSGSDNLAATRPVAQAYSGDVVYVSMLMRFQLAPGNNKFAALWFDQTGFSNIPNIGIKTNRGTGGGPEDLFVRTRTNNDVYTMAVENGVSYLLVGRLSKSTPGANQPYDSYELWVNPISLSEQPALADVVSVGDSTVSSFAQIGFRTENLTATDLVTLDRIALGTSWQDVVTPSEPEIVCLAESFGGDLADWVTASSQGSFTPTIVNGRLRMTQAVGNQATSATFQRLYPADDNLVIIEFDYWAYGGNGADGLALVLSDATVTPQPGSFGGPLGYGFKPGIPGFAGGWLGFGLDEYGNFSNEGGSTNIGRRQQSVVVRGSGSGTSGYRYLRGTCNNGTTNTSGACLDPRVDGNAISPHRYRFTIDSTAPGTTVVSVERDHDGSGFISLIAPFDARSQTGQVAAPENFFLSLTGSTGGSTNIHELDNISICALRSMPVGQQIDHFEFDYSGQALTCKPETLTVRACANADCSSLITEPVTATLSPATIANGGWTGGNTVSFTGGTTAVELRRNVAGSTLIGVSGSVPGTRPLSQTLCRAGAGALTTAACNISFASAGLVFSVPDGIASQPANNIRVAAVRQSDVSQQCVPQFANVSRDVGFWSSYIDPGPTGRPASIPLQVNGSNISLAVGALTNLPLNFDGNGEALISVNYADAGQVQLNARYSGSPANDDNGLVLNGSDQFIRRPAGLCIQNEGHCMAADATCPVFKRAGELFPLTISAHAWQDGSADICSNPVTPNFQHADITLSHSLIAPAGEPGSLGRLTYAHQRAATGITTTEQSVSEVGVFRFNTESVTYLTMADPIPAASGQVSGRFVPADFAVSDLSYSAACDSFSYMQQPFSLGFTLTARNTQGQRTRNYFAGFAKATLLLQAENADDGIDLTGRLTSSGFGSWELGQQLFSSSELRINRQGSGAADGPFTELTVALNVIDPDGSLVANPDTNVSNVACSSDSSCDAAALLLTDIRYGRMQMANGFGPEFDDLPVNLMAEYWDGSRFQSNSADNCSVISAASLNLSNSLTIAQANATELSSGKTPVGGLLLLAPDESGTVGATYQVPLWLQYDWNDDGSYNNSPVAEFMFGRYRGNPRQIYWRERF